MCSPEISKVLPPTLAPPNLGRTPMSTKNFDLGTTLTASSIVKKMTFKVEETEKRRERLVTYSRQHQVEYQATSSGVPDKSYWEYNAP